MFIFDAITYILVGIVFFRLGCVFCSHFADAVQSQWIISLCDFFCRALFSFRLQSNNGEFARVQILVPLVPKFISYSYGKQCLSWNGLLPTNHRCGRPNCSKWNWNRSVVGTFGLLVERLKTSHGLVDLFFLAFVNERNIWWTLEWRFKIHEIASTSWSLFYTATNTFIPVIEIIVYYLY